MVSGQWSVKELLMSFQFEENLTNSSLKLINFLGGFSNKCGGFMKIGEQEAIRPLFTEPLMVIARMAQANRAKGLTLIMVDGMAHSRLICKLNSAPRV